MKYELIQRKREHVWFLPLKDEAINLDDYEVTYRGEVTAENDMDALNQVFTYFNRDDRVIASYTHSMSVNDMARIEDRLYICDNFGWRRIYESLVEGKLSV